MSMPTQSEEPQVVILDARIVPWEPGADTWGISIRYTDGEQLTYRVGSAKKAEAELKLILAKQKPGVD